MQVCGRLPEGGKAYGLANAGPDYVQSSVRSGGLAKVAVILGARASSPRTLLVAPLSGACRGLEARAPRKPMAHRVGVRLRNVRSQDAGHRAIESLRLEKGSPARGSGIGPDRTPPEAGLGWPVYLASSVSRCHTSSGRPGERSVAALGGSTGARLPPAPERSELRIRAQARSDGPAGRRARRAMPRRRGLRRSRHHP